MLIIDDNQVMFGARICNIIYEAGQKGFSDETIEIHVEKGESTFNIGEIERADV